MKILYLVIFLCCFTEITLAQPFKDVPNGAFQRGEKLTYRIYYKTFLTGKINAGELTLEVKKDDRKFNGRSTYHIECIGKSRPALKWLMKVEDHYESYIDEKAMFPWLFIRKTREGSYSKDDEVEFSPNHNVAISRNATKRTPQKVQDILSAFYFARTTDFSKLLPDEHFLIPVFLDDSVYVSAVFYKDKEAARTPLGKFNCLKFKPMVVTGKLFNNRYPMTFWISDDKNKIPIHIESSLFIGKVEVELIESKGLANPMTSKIDTIPKSNPKR